MIHAALVEDNDSEAQNLQKYVTQFTARHGEKISLVRFSNADRFLAEYRHNFDLVFMDIEMPGTDGMAAAQRLREIDQQIVLMFVTNMTQFAVKGYAVNALDYIIKPLTYEDFEYKLQRAVDLIRENQEAEITIVQPTRIVRLSTRKIQYVEVAGHKLGYHTGSEVVQGQGTLSEAEKQLAAHHFLRCNSCYLVNPKYIESVKGYTVTMRNGDELQISHPRKKKFMADMANWLGQGNYS